VARTDLHDCRIRLVGLTAVSVVLVVGVALTAGRVTLDSLLLPAVGALVAVPLCSSRIRSRLSLRSSTESDDHPVPFHLAVAVLSAIGAQVVFLMLPDWVGRGLAGLTVGALVGALVVVWVLTVRTLRE